NQLEKWTLECRRLGDSFGHQSEPTSASTAHRLAVVSSALAAAVLLRLPHPRRPTLRSVHPMPASEEMPRSPPFALKHTESKRPVHFAAPFVAVCCCLAAPALDRVPRALPD